MKRIILSLLLIFIAITVECRATSPETLLYDVKGTDSLWLDHYKADVSGHRPCVMFVFGGAFTHGQRDAKRYHAYFDALTKAGYDVVSIDYRLGMRKSGEEEKNRSAIASLYNGLQRLQKAVDMAVEDLFAATRFVVERSVEWQIDCDKIMVSGSSAGAITALQAENYICNGAAMAQILPEGFNYAGLVSFAGAIFSTSGTPEWRTAPCPMMLFHGNSDNRVPYDNASLFGVGFYGSASIVRELDALSSPYYFYSATYRDHAMAVEPMTDNINEVLSFIDSYVICGRQLQQTLTVCDPTLPLLPTSFRPWEYMSSNYGK